jgi:hypothetical protein
VENALEENRGGFGVGVLGSPFFGELALDRGLEHGGSIALQVGPHPLQSGHAGVEVGEEFLDLGDDAALLGYGWDENIEPLQITKRYSLLRHASCGLVGLG